GDVRERLVAGKSKVSHNEDVLAGSNLGSHHELEGEPLPATPADFQLAGSLGGTEQAENAEVADLSLVVIVEWNDAGLRRAEPETIPTPQPDLSPAAGRDDQPPYRPRGQRVVDSVAEGRRVRGFHEMSHGTRPCTTGCVYLLRARKTIGSIRALRVVAVCVTVLVHPFVLAQTADELKSSGDTGRSISTCATMP